MYHLPSCLWGKRSKMKIRQQSGRDLSHPAVIEKMLYLLEKRQSAFLDGSYSRNYAVSSLHHRPPEEGGGGTQQFYMGRLRPPWGPTPYPFKYHCENCERFEPRSHFKSRLSLIVEVNVGLLFFTVTDVSTTCAVVIFRVKMSLSRQLMALYSGYWSHWSITSRCCSVKPWCYWLWRLVISN